MSNDFNRLWSPRPAWMTDAACRGMNPDLFYPEVGTTTAQAKHVCRTCPVNRDCLTHAIDTGENFGIWGAHSTNERKAVRNGTQPKPITHGTVSGERAHRYRGEAPCPQCRTAANEYTAARRAAAYVEPLDPVDELVTILEQAHARMDTLGYPSVDTKGCTCSGDPCSNLGGHTSEPGALKRPGSDRNPMEVPMSVHSTRRVNPQHKAGAA
jgi:hypothetical protein